MQQKTRVSQQTFPLIFQGGEIAVLKAGKYHKYIKKLQIVDAFTHLHEPQTFLYRNCT